MLTTGGSSSGSGIGVNANFIAAAIGTETSGSILSPASANGVVGIKPTAGLVSRDGIIPITADQDTAGPIARTVTDAAIMLGVVAGYDPHDSATAPCLEPGNSSTTTRSSSTRRRCAVRLCRDHSGAPGASRHLRGLPGSSRLFHRADVWAETGLERVSCRHAGCAAAAQALDISPGNADTARYLADRALDLAVSRGGLDDVYNGPDNVAGTADDFDAILVSGNSFAATPAKAG